MIKVLNIGQFIPIGGLRPDNDISLRIYSDLYKKYGIYNEFVKPVGNGLKLMALIKRSSKVRQDIFAQTNYFDKKHNIKIHFYKDRFPLINRIPFNTSFILPLEYKIYKNALKNIIHDLEPDLIHAHSIHPDGYYAMELSQEYNIPFIITLRGVFSRIYSERGIKKILEHASAITTPSYSLWQEIKNDYDINLIPHGIDDGWFSEKQKTFNSDMLRLVTVSRLLKMKNIHIVLHAMAILIRDGYKITYDIIGDGEYGQELKRLTKELKLTRFVNFHGYQNTEYIKRIYREVDIFVMLSYPETYGLSFFEAAAQGLYIIGKKNTGAYGHLTENEASFIDIDVSQLVEALKKIDVKEFNAKNNEMELKINNFRNSKIIDQYFDIISTLS